MTAVALLYNQSVGGRSALSLEKVLQLVELEVVRIDYRAVLQPQTWLELSFFSSENIREKVLLSALKKARKILDEASVDALVIPGSNSMVHSKFFGKNYLYSQEYDLARDIATAALLYGAMEKNLPILGICGGLQIIATFFGGEVGYIKPELLPSHKLASYEPIIAVEGTDLYKVLGGSFPLKTFFFHSHVITKMPEAKNGSGFMISAYAEQSGLIEAIEGYGCFSNIKAFQFHPEVALIGLPSKSDEFDDAQHAYMSSSADSWGNHSAIFLAFSEIVKKEIPKMLYKPTNDEFLLAQDMQLFRNQHHNQERNMSAYLEHSLFDEDYLGDRLNLFEIFTEISLIYNE